MKSSQSIATRFHISSDPAFLKNTRVLAEALKILTEAELKALCNVSVKLSVHVKSLYVEYVPVDNEGRTRASLSTEHRAKFNAASLMYDGPAFKG